MKYFVYAIKSGGEVLYVGCTSNPRKREHGHKNTKDFPDDAYMSIEQEFTDRKKALACEKRIIQMLRPKLNVAHRHGALIERGKPMDKMQAKKIWFSHPRLTNKEVLKLMPGWSYAMACYHFGTRFNGKD